MTKPAFVKEETDPPTWELGDFSLRPLRIGDEIAWHEYLADSRVTQNTSIPEVDLEAVRILVQRHVTDYATASSCRWALANSHGNLIGTCGFSNWSLAHAHAELVYDLSPTYWQRGLMRRAVETVLRWAFLTAGFNRIHALVIKANEPSVALLERCGFAREGTLRQYRVAHGTARDCYIYALLRQDFQG